jgi:hypothetical protein
VTLTLLPQPDARQGRDRLEILAALISSPSFDPLFRPDMIRSRPGTPFTGGTAWRDASGP